MNTSKNYCVILAGGKGKRLWPCSKENLPKQFIDLFGSGKTSLQQTFERVNRYIPAENILISTNKSYVDLVKEQLPLIKDNNILAEPVQRGTAPCMEWAAFKINDRCENANIIAIPADLMIMNEEKFSEDMTAGLQFVDGTEKLLTIGVKATRPETEYGYIQIGGENPVKNVYRVKSFTEKPELEFAKAFLESGEFFWNTSIFISTAYGIMNAVNKILPSIFRDIRQKYPNLTIEEENEFVYQHFSQYPNVSLEQGVLEKSDEVYVMTCNFGWADLGTWHNLYELLPKNEEKNVILNSKAIMDDCQNSIIMIDKGKLAVLNGLNDYVVIDKNDVLLVCRKEHSSQLIRKYINDAQVKYDKEFI
ncbi:MAG: sugar phosphate nucleotidyltransferase [Prevotellaceae bacterium]|nr:sugar phosphate nucleotidyltransferase [Prevotellaceae bacterium]